MFLAIGGDTEEAMWEDIRPVPMCNAQCERRMGAVRPWSGQCPLSAMSFARGRNAVKT